MKGSNFKVIALIPARSGSERIKNKNIMNFYKHPLLAYTINSAINAKIFDKVFVSTDMYKYAKIAKYYGADVDFLRPKRYSKATSPDFEWVKYTLEKFEKMKKTFTHFFILRPTNPFRNEKTIVNAWNIFKKFKKTESLRAVSLAKNHPGKMWLVKSKRIFPLQNYKIKGQPSYNNQFKVLPRIYMQNASLEISKTNVIKKYKTISGKHIIPFYSGSHESIDINYNHDILNIQSLIKSKVIIKPEIKKKSYFKK